MRRRESVVKIALWLAFAACFAAMLFQTFRFAPATFRRPKTVVSNGDARFYEPQTEPFLLLMSEASAAIPAGSTVSVVAPPGRDPRNWPAYILAIGQFPRQRVIFEGRFVPPGPEGEVPRFAVCYGGEFLDARFRRVRTFPEGNLYEAAR